MSRRPTVLTLRTIRKMRLPADKSFVIYDKRKRWVAALNIAVFVAFSCISLRVSSGIDRYIIPAFCIPFYIYWIPYLLFGFRLKLLSDGGTLHWQDGKKVGSVSLAQIRKVRIGISISKCDAEQSTEVRLQLRSGTEVSLPPNIADNLYFHDWRDLKRLLSHIRTVTWVQVEPMKGFGFVETDWKDEPDGAAKAASPHH